MVRCRSELTAWNDHNSVHANSHTGVCGHRRSPGSGVTVCFNFMLSRLQLITPLALLATAVAGAALLAAQQKLFWAMGVLGMTIFAHATILATEFVLLTVANRRDPAPVPRLLQLIRAWWAEVLITPRVFCWQQPFRSNTQPDHLPPSAAGRVGIVLVHGMVCNRGLWNPWLWRLRKLGIPFVAVNLEPVFGAIEGYAPLIEQAVQQIERATSTRPLIVAHSMGGLAVRAWICAYRAERRVSRVVTIGTPHRGTLLARFALTLNVRQMRLQGPWLRALEQRETSSPYSRFTCFYSHCDNLILPASSATLPGADNRHIEGTAHVHLARQEVVFDEVVRLAMNPEHVLKRGLAGAR